MNRHVLAVRDYDLAATLASGQAFRWRENDGGWVGMVGSRWVRLRQEDQAIVAQTATRIDGWDWLEHYLQTEVDLASVLATFPDDEPMRAAGTACRGLRLLRQDPWECLASFILSSTKQIVQIQQIVALLCERFGDPLAVPAGYQPAFAFPSANRLAACAESELRACKMGFRAPNLLRTARMISEGAVDLSGLRTRTVDEARLELNRLPGVGDKIANCVLLFAYGFQQAFPVDVWVMKALQQLYFPRRRVSAKRLARFVATHFGSNAGYAQQYLFHYMRTRKFREEG
jgi:N-glycosylase/DNA lyase